MTLRQTLLVLGMTSLAVVSCGGSESKTPDAAVTPDSAAALDLGAGPDVAPILPDAAMATDGSTDQTSPDASSDLLADTGAADASPDAAAVVDASEPDATTEVDATLDAGTDAVAMCGKLRCDCTFNGKSLKGRVRYVMPGALYDVRVLPVTNNLADLYVQEVGPAGLTTKCGQWRVDDLSFELRVLRVQPGQLADFTIQYVMGAAQPGLPGMRF